jgi:hypothetical protein
MRTKKLLAVPFCLALLLGAGACSSDTKDSAKETAENAQDDVKDAASDASDAVDDATNDAAEMAARNLASAQGEDEFSAKDIDIEGDLECEATSNGDNSALDISCTGMSTDGKELALEGTTSEMPGASVTELEGSFTGTADGTEVFAVDTLGG